MDKTFIGMLFIIAGLLYGCLAFENIYSMTLGYLVENKWINPPLKAMTDKSILGRKPTIFLFSFILIIIGVFIIWNRKL